MSDWIKIFIEAGLIGLTGSAVYWRLRIRIVKIEIRQKTEEKDRKEEMAKVQRVFDKLGNIWEKIYQIGVDVAVLKDRSDRENGHTK